MPKQPTFTSDYNLGDRVTIDGDESLVGIVTMLSFRKEREPMAEVSWVSNGDAKAPLIECWRLRKK